MFFIISFNILLVNVYIVSANSLVIKICLKMIC